MLENNKSPRLLTIAQFASEHSWPSQGSLRFLIFNERTNGFSSVVRRVGKRVLIDEQKFFQWVEKLNEVQSA